MIYKNMPLRSTSDFVVPHQLCLYCTALVEKATCLKNSRDELLLSYFDQQIDNDPVQHTFEAYPSIWTIALNGNEGCHFCCIVMCRMSRAAVKESLDSRRDVKGVISAVIRLYADGRGRGASFGLSLYQSRYPWEDELAQQIIRRIDLHRLKNQNVMNCHSKD